jgi:hypothetical protein
LRAPRELVHDRRKNKSARGKARLMQEGRKPMTARKDSILSARRGLMSAALLAVATPAAAIWGNATTITGYYVYSDGGAYITTANNQNPDSCPSSTYLYIPENSAHFKEIWATIIAAQATGSTVSLRYEGCSGSYPLVIAVAVPHIW